MWIIVCNKWPMNQNWSAARGFRDHCCKWFGLNLLFVSLKNTHLSPFHLAPRYYSAFPSLLPLIFLALCVRYETSGRGQRSRWRLAGWERKNSQICVRYCQAYSSPSHYRLATTCRLFLPSLSSLSHAGCRTRMLAHTMTHTHRHTHVPSCPCYFIPACLVSTESPLAVGQTQVKQTSSPLMAQQH